MLHNAPVMTEEQFEAGIEFFTCEVSFEIDPDSKLIIYPDEPAIGPRIISGDTVQGSIDRDAGRAIESGAKAGQVIAAGGFLCPFTRVGVAADQILDARNLMAIFAYVADENNHESDEIDLEEAEEAAIVNLGRNLYNRVLNGEDDILTNDEKNILEGFGINLEAPVVALHAPADEEEEEIADEGHILDAVDIEQQRRLLAQFAAFKVREPVGRIEPDPIHEPVRRAPEPVVEPVVHAAPGAGEVVNATGVRRFNGLLI